jgi:S1-C subfamily serine protease
MTHRLKMLVAAALGFGAGALAVLLALAGGNRLAETPVPAVPTPPAAISYADAVARAAPSVLRIFGQRYAAAPGTRPPSAPDPGPADARPGHIPGLNRGSAVVISDDGLLVTSGHLVADADSIGVQLPDRRIVSAKLLGVDVATDLAVLQPVEPTGPAIAIGEPGRLRPGDVVLAIGNPFGLDQTASFGIVSATGRTQLGLTEIEDFIQTDAAVNPGNSGGALIDTSGRLVGINTAIMSDSGYAEGVAFAIPADRVMRVVTEIAAHGTVERGWIGIGARTLDATLAERFGVRARSGVFVTRVLEDSPAAAAGLRAGDVIVRAGVHEVASSPALREAVIAAGAGGRIDLEIRRGSERLTASVRTARRPATAAGAVAVRGCLSGDGC